MFLCNSKAFHRNWKAFQRNWKVFQRPLRPCPPLLHLGLDHCQSLKAVVWLLQSASNLLNRYRASDTNLYQRNLEAQALLAQQQALGMGVQGLSSQSALELLQVGSLATTFFCLSATQQSLLGVLTCVCRGSVLLLVFVLAVVVRQQAWLVFPQLVAVCV